MYYAGDNVGIKDGYTVIFEDKHKFFFTGSHDALYVHNAATTNKLATIGNGTRAAGSWTAEGTVWAVGVSPKGGGLAFGPQGGLDGNSCWNECNYTTNATSPDFTTWSANDDGSIFIVELATELTFPEEEKFYTIECPLFENVQGVAKGLYIDANGSLGWNTVNLTDKNYYWIPVLDSENGTIALKNLGTEKYLNGTDMADAAQSANLKYLGYNQFNIKVNGTTVHANGHGEGHNASGNIVSWVNTANTGSGWRFIEREDPDAVVEVSVVYNFTYEGVTKYTQTVNTIVGEQYPAITTEFPFGVSATVPTGEISAEDIEEVEGVNTITKDIELEVNLPFVPATSYNEITNWYYMNISNGARYLYHTADAEYIDLTKTAVDLSNKDAYTWAFIGDPFNGYQIVNKAAGSSMILSSSTTTTDGNTGGNTYPIMTTVPVAEGNNTHWVAISSSDRGENGFYLAQKDYASNKMNYRNDKLAYWNSGANHGSTFMVVSVAEEDAAIVNEFKEYAISGLGYVGGYTTDKADAINAIATYEDLIAFKAANAPIAFDENKYYKIQNVFRTTFIAAINGNRTLATESNAIDQIWQVEAVETEGKYLIKSPNAGYMQAVGNNALAAEGTELYIDNFGKEGCGQFAIQMSRSEMLAGINNTTLGSWYDGDIDGDMAYRFIATDEISVTINEFASIYLPVAVETPEGVTAYAVEETKDSYVLMTEKSDIPANKGAILAGNGECTLKIIDEATSDWSNNLLEGTTVNAYVEGSAYVLAKPENAEIGLYKATLNKNEEGAEGTTHFLNNANKAYLVVPTEEANAIAAYSFNFDWNGTTGIENIEDAVEENATKAIYDITGRQIKAITVPGIYIINGKKTFVK